MADIAPPLCEFIAEHNGTTYYYFYRGRLSNFRFESFIIDNVEYCCGEQHIMARKALLMGDHATHGLIMREHRPIEIKKLGRRVGNWNQELWDANVYAVALETCRGRMLGERGEVTDYGRTVVDQVRGVVNDDGNAADVNLNFMFVEASPTDAIWGSGQNGQNSHATLVTTGQFRGQNILGRAITEVVTDILNDPW